jgi:hypothetical protein
MEVEPTERSTRRLQACNSGRRIEVELWVVVLVEPTNSKRFSRWSRRQAVRAQKENRVARRVKLASQRIKKPAAVAVVGDSTE